MAKRKIQLKDCPCCGKPAGFKYESGSWGYYAAKHAIECTGCGIRTPWVDEEEQTAPKGKLNSAELAQMKAAVVWNNRVAEKKE